MDEKALQDIVFQVEEACFAIGEDEKQWHLYQIAKILHNEGLLTIELSDVDKGVAP